MYSLGNLHPKAQSNHVLVRETCCYCFGMIPCWNHLPIDFEQNEDVLPPLSCGRKTRWQVRMVHSWWVFASPGIIWVSLKIMDLVVPVFGHSDSFVGLQPQNCWHSIGEVSMPAMEFTPRFIPRDEPPESFTLVWQKNISRYTRIMVIVVTRSIRNNT